MCSVCLCKKFLAMYSSCHASWKFGVASDTRASGTLPTVARAFSKHGFDTVGALVLCDHLGYPESRLGVQQCVVQESCRAPPWPSAIDAGLHPLWVLASYVVRSGLVMEGHHGRPVAVPTNFPTIPQDFQGISCPTNLPVAISNVRFSQYRARFTPADTQVHLPKAGPFPRGHMPTRSSVRADPIFEAVRRWADARKILDLASECRASSLAHGVPRAGQRVPAVAAGPVRRIRPRPVPATPPVRIFFAAYTRRGPPRPLTHGAGRRPRTVGLRTQDPHHTYRQRDCLVTAP